MVKSGIAGPDPRQTEGSERYEVRPIEQTIMTIRGQKVILDADLARIYGVPTKRLNEQVRRNADRFPPDFAFVLTREEVHTVTHVSLPMPSLNTVLSWWLTSSAASEPLI
jgi:hypothetical protein